MSNLFSLKSDRLFFHHLINENTGNNTTHIHDEDCELYYFMSGKGYIYIEGNQYSLRSGDVFIIDSGEAHRLNIEATAPYERCSMHFKKAFIRQIDTNGQLLKPFEERPIGTHNRFRKYDFRNNSYLLYLNNMMDSAPDPELQIATNLFPLLYEIYIAYNKQNFDDNPNDKTTIANIITYINDNLEKNISLESICKQNFISKAQLWRSFKETTGYSPWNYITLKRLIKAKQLIESGEAPTKIFSECGFSDYTTFYRAYKKHFGHSPNQH